MKQYDRTSHTVYHHRYHLVWITKYRYRVLTTAMKKRVRDLIAQVAEALGVSIQPFEHGHYKSIGYKHYLCVAAKNSFL